MVTISITFTIITVLVDLLLQAYYRSSTPFGRLHHLQQTPGPLGIHMRRPVGEWVAQTLLKFSLVLVSLNTK
jgi:hypothetical protein